MPTDMIMQYGALGVILFAFVFLLWKGVPAFKEWLDKLIQTFKDEIKAERDLGQQMLREERDANAKRMGELVEGIGTVRSSVDGMRTEMKDFFNQAKRP